MAKICKTSFLLSLHSPGHSLLILCTMYSKFTSSSVSKTVISGKQPFTASSLMERISSCTKLQTFLVCTEGPHGSVAFPTIPACLFFEHAWFFLAGNDDDDDEATATTPWSSGDDFLSPSPFGARPVQSPSSSSQMMAGRPRTVPAEPRICNDTSYISEPIYAKARFYAVADSVTCANLLRVRSFSESSIVGILSLYPPCTKKTHSSPAAVPAHTTYTYVQLSTCLTEPLHVHKPFAQPDMSPDGFLHPKSQWTKVSSIDIDCRNLLLDRPSLHDMHKCLH